MNGRIGVLEAYGGEFELRENPGSRGACPSGPPGPARAGRSCTSGGGEMKEVYGAIPKGDPLRISRTAIAMGADL